MNRRKREFQIMKSAVSFLGCGAQLIGSRVLLAATIGVFVLGISFGHAQTPSQATASISSQVVCHISETNKNFNPSGDVNNFRNECGPVVADWGAWGKTTYIASSNIISFKFVDPADGMIGKFEGRASSSMGGYSKNFARAIAGVNLFYYFNIVRLGNPPFPIGTIPILFTARGEGKVEAGYGTFGVAAFVSNVPGTGFPSNLFKIGGSGKPYAAWIGDNPNTGRSVTLDLPVNDPRYPYRVQVSGNAVASSPSLTTLNITNDVSTVSVSVYGTIIRLDQATFNTRCTLQNPPKQPFTLSDYYRLEFSPNVIVRR